MSISEGEVQGYGACRFALASAKPSAVEKASLLLQSVVAIDEDCDIGRYSIYDMLQMPRQMRLVNELCAVKDDIGFRLTRTAADHSA
jgi:hypothetical protein